MANNRPPLKEIHGARINGILGHGKTSVDMVGSFRLNLDLGGCSGTRVMTIFVFYVGPHFPNIQDFDVCEGSCRYIKLFGGI